jgi:HK97 gp10 family phage protein
MAKTDLSKLQDFINKFPNAAEQMGKEAAKSAAVVLQRQMKEIMGSGGGPPAPAGAPPAIRKGTLRRSIQIQENPTEIKVGSGLEYARYLEYGTSKMAARPWLQRSFNLAKTRMSEAAHNAMSRYFKKFTGG